jgi:hypothetical protein
MKTDPDPDHGDQQRDCHSCGVQLTKGEPEDTCEDCFVKAEYRRDAELDRMHMDHVIHGRYPDETGGW